MNESSTDKARAQRARTRTVPRGRHDRMQVTRIGHRQRLFRDMYASFLAAGWLPLLLFSTVIYVISNFLFATIYYLNLGGIENAHTFADAFFFSVQTMATIGYGRMAPLSVITNTAVTIEAFWGFAFFAFFTGVVFAKFSLPRARVLFSDVAVISNYNGVPHLKFRVTNQRAKRIVDVNARFFLLRHVITKEGRAMRQFYDLPLVRSHLPFLTLSWTLMHPIDEKSPLFGLTEEQLRASDDELVVSMNGLDGTLSQAIYAQHAYLSDEVIYNAFFDDILTQKDGAIEVNYRLFHSYHRQNDADGRDTVSTSGD